MTPPVQRLADGVLLLTGPAVEAVAHAIAVAQRARARNGLPPSAAFAAIAAAAGHTDSNPLPADQTQTHEQVTVAEAAQLLGISTRTARRLAPRLGGCMIAGRWVLDQRAVLEHRDGMTAA